jgi:spheroidene monooxygenase
VSDLHKKGINIQTVTVSFFQFDSHMSRIWAFVQMGFARLYLSRVPGLTFYKLFGTGSDEGFTFKVNPLSNTGVYAILAVWPNANFAKEGVLNSKIFQKYKEWSKQNWTIFLKPISVRGSWSGKSPFSADEENYKGQVVALTRASIKIKTLLRFWEKVPEVQQMIGSDKNVLFKIGMGEVPWFHQVTFSIWPNQSAMDAFARKNGAHSEAIKSVRKGEWFSEELYARFKIFDEIGAWDTKNPNIIGKDLEVT